jgi:uridine kinase
VSCRRVGGRLASGRANRDSRIGRRRDTTLFGSADEVERRYRLRYIPGQELYIAEARPEEAADAVVVNDDPVAPLLRVR